MIQVNLTDSTQLETPAPQSEKKQLFFTIISAVDISQHSNPSSMYCAPFALAF
jgi:hypothetical protein